MDHLLRSIDRFVDLSSVRTHLAGFYTTSRGTTPMHAWHAKAALASVGNRSQTRRAWPNWPGDGYVAPSPGPTATVCCCSFPTIRPPHP